MLKKFKSVQSFRYMDEFLSPTNDFPLHENCQLYIIAKYKASNCCKIETVIQRCSVKKVFFKILQNLLENPCARVSFLNKVAAYKGGTGEYYEVFKNIFFIEHLRWLPVVKLEPIF